MPTPKKKTSRARKGHRRSHDGLEIPAMAFDPKLKEYVRPHTAFKAPNGAYYYKGREVLPPKSPKNKPNQQETQNSTS